MNDPFAHSLKNLLKIIYTLYYHDYRSNKGSSPRLKRKYEKSSYFLIIEEELFNISMKNSIKNVTDEYSMLNWSYYIVYPIVVIS